MKPVPAHALVTGASSGLGAALARAYAARGTRLTLLGRDPARLAAVADPLGAMAVCCEVTDAAAMTAAVAAADARAPLELVVANAGIAASDGVSAGREVLATNVLGVWHTVTPALQAMAPRGRGQLALMSSLAGYRGLPGAAAYGASKAAVRVMAEALRAEWAPRGIRVSAICPGFVDTPLTRKNRFAMPWLVDADTAARRIVQGLAGDRARIAFPWPLDMATRLAAMLPAGLVDPLLRRRR